jgi:hypothetical protein
LGVAAALGEAVGGDDGAPGGIRGWRGGGDGGGGGGGGGRWWSAAQKLLAQFETREQRNEPARAVRCAHKTVIPVGQSKGQQE